MSNSVTTHRVSLLPKPKRFQSLPGFFRLADGVPIVLSPDSDESDFRTACALSCSLSTQSGMEIRVETHALNIVLSREDGSGESYSIAVRPERIVLSAAGPAGLRYSAETLSQLSEGVSIPACDIEDAPDLRRRGLLIDISRGKVPTQESLRNIVDLMVRLKLNVLMLYTEHVFRFRRHPDIGKDSWPLDAQMLRELDHYAAERYVELIPTLQSLGHMHQILKIERYAHLAESEKKWSLSPAVTETYELLKDLYAEYLPNFRSEWFNANCDEPVDLGKGKSKELAEKRGLGTVFLDHVEQVRKLASSLGKKTMIWSDVVHEYPQSIADLSPELMLLDWWYEKDHDFNRVQAFAKHKIPFMVCAGTSSWNALFPRVTNALANITKYAEVGKKYGAEGFLNTDWGDGGHYNLFGNSLLCIAWGAQAAWGTTEVKGAEFDRAFSRQLFSDITGATARYYRRLGHLHNAGFRHFNNSPIKTLYFEDLSQAPYTQKIRPKQLQKTLMGLKNLAKKLDNTPEAFCGNQLVESEFRLGLASSILAARKGLAGKSYVEWRLDERRLNTHERRKLAKEMKAMADEQLLLGRELQRLWLLRSYPSNFEITWGYLKKSVRSLRQAARKLQDNNPPRLLKD